MPIKKASEPLGPRPVIIAWYGDPGIGKTSLFNTCAKPLLVDGDRGVSRSTLRKDTLIPDDWDEVLKLEKEGAFKGYATIGIDTPKAILDDFLMSYVIKTDPKLQRNKLGAYGEIGNEFKLFLNNRRQDKADVAIICHARKDEDTKRMIPDVTGQSLNLILRVADMIGYYTVYNGKRMLFFEPTETTFGKNVACLPPIEVPDKTDPAFKTFMGEIYERVRAAIASRSEEQDEAEKQSALYQGQIAAAETPDQLTELLTEIKKLDPHLMIPLTHVVAGKAKEKGWVPNKQTMRYEAGPAQQGQASAASPAAAAPAAAAPAGQPSIDTPYEERCKALAELGMDMQMDMAIGHGITLSYDQIGDMPEKEYMETIGKINDAKNAPKQRRSRPAHVANPH
jgi:AAA domain